MYSYGPPHMAEHKQDDQLEHTYSSYMRIRNVALKTCQRRWMIGRSGERGSGISVLAARHDDNNDDSLHRVKWFQILLCSTNNSIQYYSFVCTKLNGSKYWYVMPIIQSLHIVKRFQVFHIDSFICTQLNGSRYYNVIPIIQHSYWFKLLLCHTNNSM